MGDYIILGEWARGMEKPKISQEFGSDVTIKWWDV
jgi:hypothetical protein